jgi:hypothetical protein
MRLVATEERDDLSGRQPAAQANSPGLHRWQHCLKHDDNGIRLAG